MAISTTISSIQYSGTSTANQACPVPFYFFQNSELTVTLLSSANVLTQLVEGTNFTVTGAGVQTGGTVTILQAVPTTSKITISRNVSETQLSSYTTGDRFPASTLEKSLDKLTMLVQQVSRAVSRSFRFSDEGSAQSALLPQPNSALGVDSSNQLKFFTTSSATGTAPYFFSATSASASPAFAPIPNNTIASAMIADSAVTSAKLATGSVGSTQLATGSVGTTQIADSAVTSAKLATGAVGTTQIADSAITSAKLATGAVGSTQLATGAVGSTQLATGAVGSTQLASSAVTTEKLANGAVGSNQLAAGAVGSTQLAAGAVASDRIASGAVGSTQLATSAVGTTQIADLAVTSAKLADSAVTTQKVNNLAITADKIANATVTPAKMGGNPSTGQWVLGASAGTVSWQTPGTVSLQDNSVTSAKLVNGAVINSKIGDNEIGASKLQAGAVGSDQLADSSVTTDKIASGAITSTKLGASTVATSNIADGAVTGAKIASGTISDSNISSTAAILGSKITPSFGAQNISTTGSINSGSISNTGNISVGTTSNTCRATIFDSTANPALLINQTGTGHAIRVEDETNPDSSPFVVDAAGNVGIGKDNPSQKLDVVGNGVFTGGVTSLNATKVACSWAGSFISTGTIALAGNTITATAGSASVTWVSNVAWGSQQIGMVYYITNIANVANATFGGRVVSNAGATDINAVGLRIVAISGTTATCTLLAGAATTSQTLTGNGAATGFTFATFGLRHSYGVNSIVRNAAGDYSITFTNSFFITCFTWITGGPSACSGLTSYGGNNIRLTFASESNWHQFAAWG